MAVERPALRRAPGLRFAKLLGTGSGRTFTVRDADPRHWALLTVWSSPAARQRFDTSPTVAGWERRRQDHGRTDLAPLAARGRWSGAEPFGAPRPSRETEPGLVAALTRA